MKVVPLNQADGDKKTGDKVVLGIDDELPVVDISIARADEDLTKNIYELTRHKFRIVTKGKAYLRSSEDVVMVILSLVTNVASNALYDLAKSKVKQLEEELLTYIHDQQILYLTLQHKDKLIYSSSELKTSSTKKSNKN